MQIQSPKFYASLPLPFTDLTALLDESDLDGKPGRAIERRHHISLHVLLPSRPSPELIANLKECKAPTITLDGLDCFENKANDVLFLKVQVEDDLLALHKLLVQEYGIPWQHPEYKPHVTIAFMKPGTAKKYLDKLDKMKATTVIANTVEFRQHGAGSKVLDSVQLA